MLVESARHWHRERSLPESTFRHFGSATRFTECLRGATPDNLFLQKSESTRSIRKLDGAWLRFADQRAATGHGATADILSPGPRILLRG